MCALTNVAILIVERFSDMNHRRYNKKRGSGRLDSGRIAVAILGLLGICYCLLSPFAPYGGGGGTRENPYLIRTAEHLQALGGHARDWDRHFRLTADIDLSQYDGLADRPAFKIIGTWEEPFTGTFDGKGHWISNLRISLPIKVRDIGLFGHVYGENAEIKDLGLQGPEVKVRTRGFTGTLVGSLLKGTLSNCCVEGGTITGESVCVGGLVGSTNGGKLVNCMSSTRIHVDGGHVGGLLGTSVHGTVMGCHFAGSVFGNSRYVGSLVGSNIRGTVAHCRISADVARDMGVVNLVGANRIGTITDCSVSPRTYEDRRKTLKGVNSCETNIH